MTIDQASFEPVYRQLARILREQIQVGELHPGAALPSEAALSQTFGVGRDAVPNVLGFEHQPRDERKPDGGGQVFGRRVHEDRDW